MIVRVDMRATQLLKGNHAFKKWVLRLKYCVSALFEVGAGT